MSDVGERIAVARVERRRTALARRLGLMAGLGVPLYCVFGAYLSKWLQVYTWNGLPMYAVWLMPLWLMIAAAVAARRRAVPSDSVALTSRGFEFAPGVAPVARDEVRAGALVPGEPEFVKIETRSGDEWFLRARVPATPHVLRPMDTVDAKALLAALGLDAASHTWEGSYRRKLYRAILWILSPVTVLGAGAVGVALAGAFGARQHDGKAAVAGILFAFIASMWVDRVGLATKATVGTDGVALRRWGFTTVYALEGLREVRSRDGYVVLTYDKGERRVAFDPDDGVLRATFMQRIEEALAARGGGGEAAARLEGALGRQGRGFDEWRKELASLLDRAEGYRTATVTRDELLAVVTNAAAPVERRVAAVLSLAKKRDKALDERVRVAVDSAALPGVRVALERAAEGELSERELEDAVEAEARAKNAR